MRTLFVCLSVLFFLTAVPVLAPAQTDYCATLPPVVQQALKHMPADQRIPCDPKHIVVITDLHKMFVDAFGSGYAQNPKLAETERRLSALFGFTFAAKYPIYLNLPADKLAMLSSENDPSGPYRLACVLEHERVHAEKHEHRESLAYTAEMNCISAFQRQGLIRHDVAQAQIALLMRDIAEFTADEGRR